MDPLFKMYIRHRIATSKVILLFVICMYNAENAYCKTLIAGQNVTLPCSFRSSIETVVWTENTEAVFPTLLSTCTANKERCIDKKQVDLQFTAFHNDTFSWITVSSDTPGNYTIACKSGDGKDVLKSFNLTFIDSSKIPTPQCDVFPYENDTSKIKFECEVDNRRIEAELEIIGAGENIHDSPDRAYSIVGYDHFIDASDVMCEMDIWGFKKACVFPRGIRINQTTEGDDVAFKIEANFEIDNTVIDWQLVNTDKTVVDITNYSLWYDDEKTSMLFRNFRSSHETEGIIVKCQITKTDENQNISTVFRVGFISLESNKTENSNETHGKTESSTNGNTTGNYNHNAIQEYQLYIMFACAFVGPLIISLLIAMWLIRKCGKKRQSTFEMSVKQVTLISSIYQGFEMSTFPRVTELPCSVISRLLKCTSFWKISQFNSFISHVPKLPI